MPSNTVGAFLCFPLLFRTRYISTCHVVDRRTRYERKDKSSVTFHAASILFVLLSEPCITGATDFSGTPYQCDADDFDLVDATLGTDCGADGCDDTKCCDGATREGRDCLRVSVTFGTGDDRCSLSSTAMALVVKCISSKRHETIPPQPTLGKICVCFILMLLTPLFLTK